LHGVYRAWKPAKLAAPRLYAAVRLADVTRRLDRAFAPDHYNYAFLQNVDRQVHMHVIPRYAAPRELAGSVFEDPDYPDHYGVPMPERSLSKDEREALLAVLLA
jgi:diadenosine tetraphosphate (Ap4A) HIT family hydrolase